MNRAILLALLIIVFGFCTCADTGVSLTVDKTGDEVSRHPSSLLLPRSSFKIPKPERLNLDNGLVVYLLQAPEIPIVTFQLIVKAGPKDDPAGKAGLCSLTLEAVSDSGSIWTPADMIDDVLDQSSAIFESRTSGSDFCELSLTVLSKQVPKVLPLFAEIITGPDITLETLNDKKKLAYESIGSIKDTPNAMAWDSFYSRIYGAHPYGRRTVGDERSLKTIKRDDLIAFHDTYFRPNNCILAVSGSFDRSDILARIRKDFGRWMSADIPSGRSEVVTPLNGLDLVFDEMSVSQSYVVMGCQGISSTGDYPGAMVVNAILGGCFTSRLVSKIRSEKGYAYNISSGITRPVDTGVFYVEFQCQSEMTATVINQVLYEFNDITSLEVSEEELDFAKDYIINNMVFNFRTPQESVSRFAYLELHGLSQDFYSDYAVRVDGITVAEVLSAAKRIFKDGSCVVSCVGTIDVEKDILQNIVK